MTLIEQTRAFNGIWEKEYPFQSNWLDLGEARLHYVDEGGVDFQSAHVLRASSPQTPGDTPARGLEARKTDADRMSTPLMFLHGNPTWSFYWRHLIQSFRGTNRCIALDHMGCGLSDKPQFYPYTLAQHIENARALVYKLDLRNIVLCVHDWGGAIGMGLAAQIPDRIKGFVVFNTAAFPSRRMPLSIGLCRLPGFGALAIRGLNAFVRGALARCAKKPLSREGKAGYLAPYSNWDDRIANLRFVQDIPTAPDHESWETLKQVEAGLAQFKQHPMLLCWGRHDFVFNDSFLHEWQHRFPQAETQYFEHAGHFVVEDARSEIIAAMKTFLGGEKQTYTDEHHSTVNLHA